MADIRARLEAALREAISRHPAPLGYYGHIAEALLSTPGIAITELPQPIENFSTLLECVGRWRVGELGEVVAYADGYIIETVGKLSSPDSARALAAALLAAANAAEQAAR